MEADCITDKTTGFDEKRKEQLELIPVSRPLTIEQPVVPEQTQQETSQPTHQNSDDKHEKPNKEAKQMVYRPKSQMPEEDEVANIPSKQV